MTIDAYQDVLGRIGRAAREVGRDPTEITLVAVSKGAGVPEIERLYDAGHRDFGENRAQEMLTKANRLPPDIRWHFVGPLQTNKVRGIRPLTHLLHSMDRLRLAETWLKGRGPAPPVLIQVNIGDEPQKSGFSVGEVPDAVSQTTNLGLEVEGLMAIPPRVSAPDDAAPFFARMRAIRDEISQEFPGVQALSMGMTEDFEVAITEGATAIRVGRAIFRGTSAIDG
ncbi:MAG: YggS family pyridoxal phosphate-dependent enzyme [Acidimicrobiia bacterium]|nr:YggS family pyridoxal phosphate-dependent enzyme [Acidimicrobiia bacterium]